MLSTKKSLRQLALRGRAALTEQERTEKSATITGLLHRWEPYQSAHHVCLYASFGSEVQTWPLLAQAGLLRQPPVGGAAHWQAQEEGVASYPPKKTAHPLAAEGSAAVPQPEQTRFFYLPRVEGEKLVIHQLQFGAASASGLQANMPADASPLTAGLVRSPMGMWEPATMLPAVEPQLLDIIIVPGSAFCAHNGHRLGYGKGFYDRLLAHTPRALKVGLGFDIQLFDAIAFPFDPHDIALDVLISESGIHDLR